MITGVLVVEQAVKDASGHTIRNLSLCTCCAHDRALVLEQAVVDVGGRASSPDTLFPTCVSHPRLEDNRLLVVEQAIVDVCGHAEAALADDVLYCLAGRQRLRVPVFW